MQKEQDEPRQDGEEQRQETEAETTQPAQTLAERVAAYRKALQSDPRIAHLHLLEMTLPLEVTNSYMPLRLYQDPTPGYDLEWIVQSNDPHHALMMQRQVERRARIAFAPEHELYMYKHSVIVGAPGTGKTTLLQYLALQAIAQQLKGLPDLPIHVALPAFARSGHRDLLAYAAAVWEERYGFPQAQALADVQQQLQDGGALLLLDGFDEMGAETTNEPAENVSFQISKAIMELATRYPQAPIVVTARKADSRQHTRLAGFAELEVLDVRPEESNPFVERWFASHPDPSRRGNAPKFRAQLERTAHLQALASNPLSLSLLLSVYDDRGALPERRAALYDQYVETQLAQRDASRTSRRMHAFRPEHHRQLLETVAWHFHQQGQCSFPERALLKIIAAYLPIIGLPPGQNGQVLEEIAAENGLLQEQARGWYGFVHLTFQEYFAAHYALDHQELDLLLRRRNDPWWEAVLFFYAAGRIPDASLLVQHLLGLTPTHPLPDDLFHTNLILAGRCLAAADPTIRSHDLSQEVVTRLFQVLQTTHYALTQTQVAETLAEMGETAVDTQLVQLLADEQLDWQLRQRIAEVLGQVGERSIVLQLVQLLSDEHLDSQVRQSITEALRQLGERLSLWRLIPLLSDERVEPRLRQQIAEAFGKREEHSLASQLVQLFSDEKLDWHVRQSIAEALGQLGERSIAPQLVQALSDEQITWSVRESITYTLKELGERSIAPQLVQLLSDEQLNTYVRQRIAEALGQLGERSVAPQMVQLLSDRRLNPRVRGSTAVGLAQLGERSIAPQLLQLLTDRKLDQSVRQSSAEALGRSGDRSMVPQLAQLVSDRRLDLGVRATIVHALGQMGGRSVAPQLVQLLSDEQEDWSMRVRIPRVLGQLGERSIRPQLLQLFSDEQLDWSMRLQIAEALGQLRERLMLPQLVQLLSDEQLLVHWPVHQALASAFGHLDEHAIVSQLLELLSDEQFGWPMRQRIAYGLGRLGERSVAPQLVELLSDKQLDVQLHERIAGALGRIGEPSIVPQLVQLLSDEQLNPSVPQRIAEVLSTLATDEATIQALAALLPISDIADSIYHLLWAMSRQMGVRIFVADRPNGNSDQMAFRIEPI